ncbi:MULTISPECIES: metallophosphoesterase family protein [unclassified Clostridium]|uniref:purple acid phosphatase family protein n=1 Tax=unclassified Clostridium TaxID=2614128 RepID=UPI001C8B4A6A|nr:MULTISPECIES: metallophosphoesterase family protein [unclassified Clostridium]MBX9138288.1 metallophosphoesterase family protein [Clostridium sp. K12(2020)]MBX9145004.1 metallophosphoesterase family protein [Clostridium sp. K13]
MIKRTKKVMAALMVAIMMITTSYTVFAAENDGWTEAPYTEAAQGGAWEAWCEKWETIKNDWTQLSITPGKNATELNFAWYSEKEETLPKVKISKSTDMSNSIEFDGTQSRAVTNKETKIEYVSNKVTVTGLEEDTTYYYSYGTNENWSSPVVINTQSTDSFSFFLVGDPQIGSSLKNTPTGETEAIGQDRSVRNDSFNWNNTIKKALSLVPNASFMISAGDQISIRDKKANNEQALAYTENEIEYAGYLSPEPLKSLPVATTLGNHDAVSGNYSYHFNNPNTSTLGSTVGGGNYYYTYGNTLFIMLNTNNTNAEEHKQFIEQAVAESGDVTWKVVTLHQDIYGSGEHSNEPEIAELRYKLVPIFEENDIDVVLTGHDHTYARSKILKGGVKEESTFLTDDEYEEFFDIEFESDYTELVEDEKYLSYLESIEDKNAIETDLSIRGENISNPEGILYITANSASGSKYYNNVPRQQAYIANRWQEDVPTFSTINVDNVSLSISTYRTDNMEKIDETVTIIKSVEYGNLVDKIEEAEAKSAEKEIYTSSTWTVFEATLSNAQKIAADSDISEAVISETYGNLKAAIDQLVLRGNVEVLNNEIATAEELANKAVVGNKVGEYPQESKDKLLSEIEEAKKVCLSDDASQVVVDEAISKLKEAVETFKKKVVTNSGVSGGMDNNGSNNGNNNVNNNNVSNNGAVNKPNSGVNTGDNSNILVYGILTAAIVGVVGLNFKRKKEVVK